MPTVSSTDATPPTIHGLAALESTVYGQQLQSDTWDLLGSLALTLRPRLCKRKLFMAYKDSFLGHEALDSLASLRFIRSPNSENPSNVTPRTVVTLKLTPSEGKVLLQNFMDARLLRDSTEPATPYTMCLFSKGGVYSFTHKALRIIQEFIQGNAIEDEADHLIATLATLPTPRPPLLRVKRIPDTKDELVITQNIVYSLFSSMCGREPNRGFSNAKGVRFVMQGRRNELLRPHFKITSNPFDGKISAVDTTQCVEVQVLTHWLLAFTALNGAADAVQIGAEFVRFGLILLIKAGKGDTASYTRTVRGPRSPLNPVIAEEAHFVYTMDSIYAVTDEGRRIAGWHSFLEGPDGRVQEINPAQRNYNEIFSKPLNEQQTASATRLSAWMKQTKMRSAFGGFLARDNLAYFLPFWLDVEDFRTACNNAADVPADLAQLVPEVPAVGSSRMAAEHAANERMLRDLHREQSHEPLNNRPFMIYNTFLAPASAYNLRNIIGDDLIKEADTLLGEILDIVTNKALVADINPFQESTTLDIGHLQVVSELYGRIQDRVFRIMVLEYVPSFMKSEQFFQLSRA
ncbi:hypothetical protein D9619_001818 [Psilocybe cf. subviscida]|uniref:RGS domain-containing protein n=1 Tax=Psilocybe cf. subviscida TaxID=2480587 RepID=A0A8H5BD80_9AGAR|nr:hypothetical protein D9619_001818 [Psilocybe cf. subviscida]